MSRRRALERKLKKGMQLVAAGADPKHGCTQCRSLERRRQAVLLLIEAGETEVCIGCPECGAFWKLELFTEGPDQQVHAKFSPNHTHDHSKHGVN